METSLNKHGAGRGWAGGAALLQPWILTMAASPDTLETLTPQHGSERRDKEAPGGSRASRDHGRDGWKWRVTSDLVEQKMTLHRQSPNLGCAEAMLQLLLRGAASKLHGCSWDVGCRRIGSSILSVCVVTLS